MTKGVELACAAGEQELELCSGDRKKEAREERMGSGRKQGPRSAGIARKFHTYA